MDSKPVYIRESYKGSSKLQDKVAIVTGGDSGIGRSVAVHYAREGCKAVGIVGLKEEKDIADTKDLIEKEGAECLTFLGNAGEPDFCKSVVETVVDKYGKLDVLVNNCSEQHIEPDIRDITPEQLENTFKSNVFSYFYMTQAALDHLPEGSCMVNTASVNAYKGNAKLISYTSTKGAEVAFTRSMALNLASKNIRVNGVAPGPVWTPLIPATFDKEAVKNFGKEVPLGRAAQPCEVGPAYVFLASEDASHMTGQFLHPNGGAVVNA